jgi:tetratricopeptide (TPR) repeat protein
MNYSEIVIAEIQNGNLEEAEENLQLALDNDEEDMLYLLGNTLYQLGFLQETRRVYNYLLDINPGDDELKIYLAEIEIEDGQELEALDLLHSIEETSEAYTQSLMVQADYYHLNGLPEVSIQKLKEAEEILPEESVVKFALAEVYFTIEDYQNAIQYYEEIVAAGEDEVAGTLMSTRLGNAHLMLGQYKEAIDYLNDALSYQDDPEVYYQLGLAYVQQEEYTQALEPLNQAKTLDASLSSVYILLAEVYEQTNKLEKALEEIEEGINFNEVNIEFYFKAADIATKLNDYEKAEIYYERAMEIEPGNDRTIIKYARFQNYMGNYEDVIELFEQAAETTRQLPEALWLLASAKNNTDEYDEARQLFEQAAMYLEDDLDFLKEYAFFLREDGQRGKMREIVQKYLTLNPEMDPEMASLLDDYDNYDDYNY